MVDWVPTSWKAVHQEQETELHPKYAFVYQEGRNKFIAECGFPPAAIVSKQEYQTLEEAKQAAEKFIEE